MVNGPHTSRGTVVAKAIMQIIEANMAALDLKAVYYGNHVMIPKTPAVVVNLQPKNRTLAGVVAPGGRTMNDISLTIDVHSSKVGEESANRMEHDELAEEIEILLHQDTTLGGIIVHGYVTVFDPGETMFQDSEFRTVRLTYNAQTKTNLPD